MKNHIEDFSNTRGELTQDVHQFFNVKKKKNKTTFT